MRLTSLQIRGIRISKNESRLLRDGDELSFAPPSPKYTMNPREDYRQFDMCYADNHDELSFTRLHVSSYGVQGTPSRGTVPVV